MLFRSMEKAIRKYNVSEDKIKLDQDPDVLDTWFSSGILPLSALGWPDTKCKDFKAFFPIQLLETGSDILFFWVARMVMMTLTLHDTLPFKTIYLHNIVKDAQGKKMSKSKGNVIDPMEIINGAPLESLIQRIKEANLPQKEIDRCINLKKKEFPKGIPQCSNDALRFSLLAYMNQGTNINLDIKRIMGYRRFCNKIWNAVKFALMYIPNDFKPADDLSQLPLSFIDKWILSLLTETSRDINKNFEKFNFGHAMNTLHDFWLHKLCDIYLEGVKPELQTKSNPILQNAAHNTLYKCIDSGLRLLHPTMPFLTEELFHRLPYQESKPASILLTPFPEFEQELYRPEHAKQMDLIMNVVQSIRSTLSTLNIPFKDKPKLEIVCKEKFDCLEQNNKLIATLARIGEVECNEKHSLEGCIMNLVNPSITTYLQVKGIIDVKNELNRLSNKLNQLEKTASNLEKKINAKTYQLKVPEEIKRRNDEKFADALNEINILKKYILDLEKINH